MYSANSKVGLMQGFPFSGRPTSMEYVFSMLAVEHPSNLTRIMCAVKGKPIAEARTIIAEEALKRGAKYLWFVDDDVAPPNHALTQLLYVLDNNAPPLGDVMVVGGVYCVRGVPPSPCVFKENGKGASWDWTVGDVFEVEGMGAGCMLIKTEVFEKLEKPWFDWSDEKILPDKDTTVKMSEDLYFCRKVREAGFKLLAHGGVQCIHYDPDGTQYLLPADSYPITSMSKKSKEQVA